CHTSSEGPEVTTEPRDEYREFSRSLRERASSGEILPTVVPPPLQGHAEKGYAPEDVAPPKADEGFLVDPSSIDWDAIDASAWDNLPQVLRTKANPVAALLSIISDSTYMDRIPTYWADTFSKCFTPKEFI